MALAPRELLLNRLEGFRNLTNGQKLGIMLAAAAIVALLIGGWIWSRSPNYKVLFSNVNDRDGGAIVSVLQQMNVPYKMAEGGGAILVPADMVYETRLKLASQGLPKGGGVGFEILENPKLGITQFQEQVNFQRALEGELARSIQSLASVQSARVHLAIPRPSVFLRDQEKPSASVLVSLYPGRVLDPAQVNGIVHLVSSSVPEMSYKNVTVVDQNGNLISKNGGEGLNAGLEPTQLEYVRQIEQGYIKRIESILTPITGPHNVHAQVAAEVDFAETEQTAETYKPNPTPAESAIRSEQTSETTGGGQAPTGVPGALSNQPPGAAAAPITAPAGGVTPAAPNVPQTGSSSGTSHRESTINYELDKSIKHVKQGPGSVKRLSVAVVVNNKTVTDKNGKTSAKPFSADEMKQINALVREAMGYNQARGDTVNVVNAAFNLDDGRAGEPFWKDPMALELGKELIKNLLILAVVLLFVFGIVRPLLAAMRPEEKAEEHLAGALAGIGGEGGFVIGPDGQPIHVSEADKIVSAEASYEEILKTIKDFSVQEPGIVATVVKEWVNE